MAVLPLLSTNKRLLHYFVAFSLIFEYPIVRRDDSVVDDYFGTKIADPYRWLENLDSEETRQFVEHQQNLTNSYLGKIPMREDIRKTLTGMWNYPTSSPPEKAGTRYFTFENTGLESQSIMYVQNCLTCPKRKFLDPNALSKDGTVSLDTYAFSRDGELLTYSVTQSGSDSKIVRFKNVGNMTDLPDTLLYTKWPSMGWSGDDKGIFYMRYPPKEPGADTAVDLNGQIFYHRIGTSQDEDILIFEFAQFPKRYITSRISNDGNYIIGIGQENINASVMYVGDLRDGIDATLKNRIIPIFPDPNDAIYFYVTNVGSTFLFQTNKDASKGKLITVKVNTHCQPSSKENEVDSTKAGCSPVSSITTFIEESKTKVIDWALPFDSNKLIIAYIVDVKHKLEIRSLRDGSLLQGLELQVGTISDFHVENKTSNEFFFKLDSFILPGLIYHCKSSGKVTCEIIKTIKAGSTDLTKIIMEQVFYHSKDGTRVPMYIVRHQEVPLDGTAPALLNGYGGYEVNLMPTFSIENIFFVEHFGGIYASANIRGGSEYGEKWHEEGRLFNKQNVFDDFQAAAVFLIETKYTKSSKLTITGVSNGGILVGVCVNQRPDLYAAAIPQVGVMDMLRFQKFTIGYVWCSEFGCSDDKAYFENLLKYSPLHNIRVPANPNVQYPAVLATTADHDDRVVPSHTFKYMAQLQYTIGGSPKQTNPLLLRVETNAGHGAGTPTSKQIDEKTDIYSFMAQNLGLEFNGDKSRQSPKTHYSSNIASIKNIYKKGSGGQMKVHDSLRFNKIYKC